MKHTATLAAALAATTLLTVGTADAAPAEGYYGTKTPYAPQQPLDRYHHAPKGFTPVFTENVARHGSRAMTDGKDGDAVLAVLDRAQAAGALTGLGEQLGPQVRSLLAAAAGIGYGSLAGLGVQEQQGTARRLEQRLPELFDSIVAGGEPIVVETSGVARVVASANAFTGALTAADPGLTGLVRPPVTDKNLLYFHKQPQNADYQAYLADDPELHATLAQIRDQPRTASVARHVVTRLFCPEFVQTLTPAEQQAFATALYQLYGAAPDLRVEAPEVDLGPFLAPVDAKWLQYLDDAEEFYEKGPAFSGRTITYKMANPLLDDLFAQAEAKAAGTSDNGAVLRFTHAEEIEPLAVLLGLPGSTEPADPAQPYTYANNPWRGARVAPMAANIQWDVYAGNAADGKAPAYLVRMLYNEKETYFPASCKPFTKGGYFYELDELKRCFGR
ncbi:histidine-type phosphatase [Kitasatospora sp. NPDC002227]|uniref:histidine-type phosphatase n=1 Tax=Kitasatospora sp. NPDC002227 TaxID=3154773 RepID=UPI003326A767